MTLHSFLSIAYGEDVKEQPITESDRNHWAFEPLDRPPIPDVEQKAWSSTPIDRFILARLEAEKIAPASLADRTTFIRRLSFNLRGLPPSPDEVHEFVRDSSPAAVENLIDRYLASPEYGERWAQHWLDLARFAETDGFEHDKVRPQAWRYRDWVINALNDDMPYDRFVSLQLAGDELEPSDEQARIATSFCLSGPDMPDINSMVERKHNVLNELTSTIGSTLLGLQFECAQCHDHKYDPISQADFYRFRAFFAPAIHLKKNQSLSVLSEPAATPDTDHLMIRGDWDRRGPEVNVSFPRIANPWNAPVEKTKPSGGTSGRRAALARWITRDDHMLTTRVIVNRVWQYHFGQGLSRSTSDFGVVGYEPSHPELLDYLATELVRQNWSLKQLHRQMLSSSVYQLSSRGDGVETPLAVDPDNRLLSRFNRQRLEGESIRDAMLSAANVLKTGQGGPGIRPPLPKELTTTLLRGQWPVTLQKSEHDRRSIYIFARRNLRYPIFEAFDRPDGNASCCRRGRSTTAPQSLFMLNSEFSSRSAQRLADYISSSADGNVAEQVRFVFWRTLARDATKEELDDAINFLKSATLTDLCLALFNTNEFIYID